MNSLKNAAKSAAKKLSPMNNRLLTLFVLFLLAIIAVIAGSCSPYESERTNRATEFVHMVIPNAECSSWSISNNDFMPDVAVCKEPHGVQYCRAGAWTQPKCVLVAEFGTKQAAQAPAPAPPLSSTTIPVAAPKATP